MLYREDPLSLIGRVRSGISPFSGIIHVQVKTESLL